VLFQIDIYSRDLVDAEFRKKRHTSTAHHSELGNKMAFLPYK
jgi:hypothetical protein